MNYGSLPSVSPAHARWTAVRTTGWIVIALMFFALGLQAAPVSAQNLLIYTDSLQNGFQNWSWATTNVSNTSPVQSGSDSIAVTYGGSYQGFYLHSGNNINTAGYSALSFWLNGGATGGQQFVIHCQNAAGATLPSVPITNYVPGGSIPANQWVQVTVPFADLGIVGLTDFNAFWFQESTGNAQPVYYVDTISLLAQPPPSVVHVSVNAAQTLQTVDSREFGVNTAIWDGNMGTTTTQSLMNAAGPGVFRFPGGSASDGYDWTVLQYNGQSATPTFGTLTDATGAQAIITANYGSGSPQMTAAWVAYCNASTTSTVAIGLDSAGRDWKTASYWATLRGATPLATDDGLNFLRVSHPTPYGFKNWEIGNECYGSWEEDNHSAKQDPVIYANVALAMTTLMKQVDPTIKTGVVVASTEDDSGNQTETVTNPVTGVSHKGWTAVLFSTLNSIGYTPDFVIYHNYAQGPGGENDAVLLQYAATWAGDATSIRTMLTQYMSTSAAATQLLCTENNSVYTNPGKQSTSLVNGLFLADSLGSLMQTEFKSLVWWDLRNGEDTSQNNSPSLYGWRLYGDYGILGNAGAQPGGTQDTPYPTYFALKLASHFARGGDTVVSATSDYNGLSAYAAKRAGGGLSLLVINKNPTASLTAQVAVSGYTPTGTATTYTYGETEDTQQSTGASVDLTQSSLSGLASTFSASFSPYSMTVVNLTPVLPVTTAALSGTLGTNSWYVSPVQVALSATAGSAWTIASTGYTIDGGAAQIYTAPFTVTADGTHTITYWSVDSAGNTEATNTLAFKIDATSPALVFGTASPAANAAGWNDSTVTVPYTASDATSGVASATPGSPLTFSAQGASQTQTVTVTDNAGNVKTFTSPAVNIDLTAPVTTASVSGATITLAATDNLSGAAVTTYTIDGGTQKTYTTAFTVTGIGSHTIVYGSADKAGNVEATHTLTLTINAAPALTSISPSSAVAGSATFTLTATGTSFAASSTIDWNGSPLTTTYVSATQLTASVPASLIASVGTASVTVVTPAPGGGTSKSKTCTINAPALSSVALSPTSVVYGTTVTGTVTLAGAAPTGGITVTLTSSNTSAATVPASVTVLAGQTKATFSVTTYSVSTSTSVTITAKAGTVSKTATLTVKPPTVPQAINCGGAAATPFIADSGYSGGGTGSTTHAVTTAGVTNPAPTAVYQSQRTGTFTYTLANLVPNANYTLRLHFCEISTSVVGSREFDVIANGITLLTNFDILQTAGGEYKVNVQQFTVTADGTGKVTVQITAGSAGRPVLNGIQIQ